jgi:hypothetical protein
MVRQQQFLNAYIFGAVCPSLDKASGFVSPCCNMEAMQIHLELISMEIKKHAVLVMDCAGWHISKALRVPQNITLLFLPPYSPELNPQENLWQQLKSRELSNRVFDSLEAIMDAAVDAWNNFVNITGNVSSTCTKTWAIID